MPARSSITRLDPNRPDCGQAALGLTLFETAIHVLTSHGQDDRGLMDIIEAMERVTSLLAGTPLEAFKADWQKQWLVQRGVEIISEASRALPEDLKARHPSIPWRKVAGIGNILRHEYGNVASPVLWTLVRESLPPLDAVCHEELAAANKDKAPR